MSGTFEGSGQHPLLAEWITWVQDHSWVWPSEAQSLAARGQWLGTNDPFVAALYGAHAQGTLGPLGLRLTSIYDPKPEEKKTDEETRQIRRRITTVCAVTWHGTDLDAEGVRTRRELEEAVDWFAFFHGDGFLIRVTKRGRSRWQIIHPERIRNPDGKANTPAMRDGFRIEDGAVVGLWVHPPMSFGGGVMSTAARAAIYVPWRAEDGTPNVVHKAGLRLPGMLRGVCRVSPMIVMLRQLHGVLESHVAAKRLQAIYGMIVEAADPAAWKAAQADGTALDPAALRVQGPLNLWVKPEGSGEVEFTDTKFNGADLKDYLLICYKVLCAVLQLPVDVVLCQLTDAALASARAGLDQFDRTNQTEQEAHISSVTSVIDEVAVRDAVVYDGLTLPTDSWAHIMAGTHERPPKYSTDRKKDAETISELIKAGISEPTAFALFGFNWEDEQELRAEVKEFLEAQGLDEGAATGDDAASIQAASLNGAQIDSLMAIIDSVAAGRMPVETARGLILAAYPSIDEAEAKRILSPLEGFKPAPVEAAAPTPDAGKPPTQLDENDDAPPPSGDQAKATAKPKRWWRGVLSKFRSNREAA
jgi:hypothetical protein